MVATDDPTTLALAELDEEGAATYRFYVDGTSVPGLTPEAALATLPERVEMVHVGTLGLVYEPTAAALEAVVEKVAGEALVMVDLNIRPLAVPDPEAYRARIDRLLPRTRRGEGERRRPRVARPRPRPRRRRRATLLSAGPSVVLLTRGGEGVTVVTADGATDVPAEKVDVVDTIGAGDAFGGGFLAWWRRAGLGAGDLGDVDAVLEATRFACVVAGRTVERAGASPPRLAEVATGLTIGFTLRGSSRLARSATSTSSSVKWPVTIASRSTAPEAARAIAAG